MMKCAFALAAALVLAPAALASDTDTFAVSGTNPDGSSYVGNVSLTELQGTDSTGDVFKVVWTIGSATNEGTGMVMGGDRKTLYLGYPVQGGVGVAIFTVNDDHTISGDWIGMGQSKVGHEVWTPQ